MQFLSFFYAWTFYVIIMHYRNIFQIFFKYFTNIIQIFVDNNSTGKFNWWMVLMSSDARVFRAERRIRKKIVRRADNRGSCDRVWAAILKFWTILSGQRCELDMGNIFLCKFWDLRRWCNDAFLGLPHQLYIFMQF